MKRASVVSSSSRRPRVSNVKVHFCLGRPKKTPPIFFAADAVARGDFEVRDCGNFTVIRDKTFKRGPPPRRRRRRGDSAESKKTRGRALVYTLFHRNGHVNITGIERFSRVRGALARFSELFGECVPESDVVIDNSTASGQIERTSLQAATAGGRASLNFYALRDFLKHPREGSAAAAAENLLFLRPHFFPGALLKHRDRARSTIILFPSAKYVIVGAKNREAIREAHERLCRILEDFDRHLRRSAEADAVETRARLDEYYLRFAP